MKEDVTVASRPSKMGESLSDGDGPCRTSHLVTVSYCSIKHDIASLVVSHSSLLLARADFRHNKAGISVLYQAWNSDEVRCPAWTITVTHILDNLSWP